MKTLGLAIPLYDEEACAESVVDGLIAALDAARIRADVVLVNNGSTDGTAGIVNRLATRHDAVRAMHLVENAGYGGGILAGMRMLQTPVVGWMWGDGQVEPQVVVQALEALRTNGWQLCKARRIVREDGRRRQAVTAVYNQLMRRGFGVATDDVNGCPKLMTRGLFGALELQSLDWFLDPELMLKLQELDAPWGEVDAIMRPRAGGVSKVRRETMIEFAQNLVRWKGGWRPG